MNSTFIKLAAQSLSASPAIYVLRKRKVRKQLLTILCLHRVSDDQSLTWPPLPVATFEKLCRYWSRYYCTTTFSRFQEEKSNRKPLLILSFDDGYADFYQYAWPLLKKYGIKANMNITTSCIENNMTIWTQRLNNAFDELSKKGVDRCLELPNGITIRAGASDEELLSANLKFFQFLISKEKIERNTLVTEAISEFAVKETATPHMSWEQIIQLNKEGLEIGGHTMTHDILTTIKDKQTIRREVQICKNILEEKIDREVKVFAFPNGMYNQQVSDSCFDAGYKYLASVDNQFFPINSIHEQKVIPRILVHHTGYAENILTTENVFNSLKTFFK